MLSPAQKEYLQGVAASRSAAYVHDLISRHYMNVMRRGTPPGKRRGRIQAEGDLFSNSIKHYTMFIVLRDNAALDLLIGSLECCSGGGDPARTRADADALRVEDADETQAGVCPEAKSKNKSTRSKSDRTALSFR